MQRRRREAARRRAALEESAANPTRLIFSKTVEISIIPPTICFAWTQNPVGSTYFWGLGDTLRGMLATYQFCKENRCNFLYDLHMHPFSQFLNFEPSDVHDKVEKTPIHFYGLEGKNILKKPKNGTIEYIYGNSLCKEPLLEDEKMLVRSILNIKKEYRIELPCPYNVYHFRFGDTVLTEKTTVDYTSYLKYIMEVAATGDVICSDSAKFKEIVAAEIPHVTVLNKEGKSSHFGIDTDLEILRTTLDDLQILIGARKIHTYSTYPWISNFVYWIARCYNIPLEKINI